MNAVLDDLYQQRQVVSRSGKRFDLFPCSIGRHKGQSLYQWVRRTRPKTTIEIGCAFGVSTLFICQALRDNGGGIHHVIVPWETGQWDSVGLDLIEKAGLGDVMRFYGVPSYVQLPKLLEEGTQVDFAFLDGQKLFDYVMIDCFYIGLMLPVGGVMSFDDPWLGSVRKAARFLVHNCRYRLINYTNRLLQGAPASPWMRATAEQLLGLRYGAPLIKPAFRFECLLYLQKTHEDDRVWDWYREF